MDGWDPATRALTISVDADADFVRVRMQDDRYNVHDYFVAGSWSGTVPGDFSGFRRAQADVEVWAVDTTAGTFEERVAAGEVDPHSFPAQTSAAVTQVNE